MGDIGVALVEFFKVGLLDDALGFRIVAVVDE
jgi:hypothetical protein